MFDDTYSAALLATHDITKSFGTVKALAAAIEIAGSTDHEAVNDALTQIKDLPAPTGTMTYGAHGNMIHSLVITQIHDLKPSVVSTVSMDTN